MRKSPFVITFILILTLSLTGLQGRAAEEKAPQELHKYYTSVTIMAGDTLWTIADRMDPDGNLDRRDYVNEVMRINRLTDPSIHAGQSLTVFYYDASVK